MNIIEARKLAPVTTLWLLVLAMLIALLWNHYHLIVYPALLDYFEGAMPAVTEVVASGNSPYSLESQPTKISVYPPLYHIVVTPFSLLFGNTLVVHRAVSGGFILAAVALCFLLTLRQSKSRLSASLAAVIFYAGLLYFSTPVASSNSIGVFFFLLTVALPWLGNFSNRSLVLALISGLVAFYCKQYFLAALGYICLYLFLCVSKKKALLFGLCSFAVLTGSLAIVQLSSPYYLDDVVFILKGITGNISSFGTSFSQLYWFLEIYIGLIVILVINAAVAIKSISPKTGHIEYRKKSYFMGWVNIDLKSLDLPLLLKTLPYFWFSFFCSLIVIALVIGKNPGNQMTYLFQLMTPLFLIAIFSGYKLSTRLNWLQVLLVVYTMYASYTLLPTDFTYKKAGWDRLEVLLADKALVYASPLVLPILSSSGGKIINNGLGQFFYFSRFKPEIFKRTAKGESSIEIWEKHVRKMHRYIKRKKFAFIILDSWTRVPEFVPDDPEDDIGLKLLKRNYRVSESITVSMANRPGGGDYTLKVWKPRK